MSQSFVQSNVESIPDITTSRADYRGNKRAACDRCRGQKLRCLQEASSSATCVRCAKAGAICSFGTSKRGSRPTGSHIENQSGQWDGREVAEASLNGQAHGSKRSKRKAVHQEHHFQPATRDNGNTLQSGGTMPDGVVNERARHTPSVNSQSMPSDCLNFFSGYETTSSASDEHIGLPSYLESSNPTLTRVEDDIGAFFNDQGPTDLESLFHDRSWSLPQFHMQDMANDYPSLSRTHEERQIQSSGISEDVEAPSNLSSHAWRTEVSGETAEKNGGRVMSHRQLSFVTDLQSQGVPHDSKITGGSTVLPAAIPTSLPLTDLTDKVETYHAHPAATREMQRRRMQELSELGMTFYQLGMEIDAQIEIPAKSSSVLDQCAGRVLQSSLKFLALLESLSPSKAPSSSDEATHATTSDEEVSISETSVTSDIVMDGYTSGAHGKRLTASSTTSKKAFSSKPQPADVIEIFGLLIGYIRILRLHSILYSKFSRYLTEPLFQEGAHLPPIFPGMKVGGVSLDIFGRFQIKLLLQISIHILGEIEMALGLPDRYRISEKGDRDIPGILEGSVSLEFIEMTMKERSRIEGGMEKDSFSSIRESLVHLRQLLRGTINT